MRKDDTYNYMKSRIQSASHEEANTSFAKKMGRLLKKLFILGAVCLLVGPHLYKSIAPQLGILQEQAASDLSNIKVPKTAQDIAKAAQEREIREMERQKQQQQEFDDLYGSGEQNYDL